MSIQKHLPPHTRPGKPDVRQPLPALLSYGENVYRPAGYRRPFPGEQYVARDGHIKTCNNPRPNAHCLIVRPYSETDF